MVRPLTRAALLMLLNDLVIDHERLLARSTALEVENRALRGKVDWIEQRQSQGYVNAAGFNPILPRKVA